MSRCIWIVAVVLASGPAHADPDKLLHQLGVSLSKGIWYENKDPHSWQLGDRATHELDPPECAKVLDQLAAEHVPASAKVQISHDAPDFKAGTYTLVEARQACETIRKAGRVKAVERWAVLAMQDTPRLSDKSDNFEPKNFENCLKVYDKAIKAGMSPSDRVADDRKVDPVSHKDLVWSGTIEEIRKKWCDAGEERVKVLVAKREAPFRAVLKADKLKMALDGAGFALAGGEDTNEPKKLAAASVWFGVISVDRRCAAGTDAAWIVTRYQFDGAHKLVKSTDAEFCGRPPLTAYH